MICFLPSQAHAVTATSGAKVYKLSANTTYKKYDITGDRKADKILIRTTSDSYSKNGISVYVNGKRVLTKKTSFYSLTAQLIKLKNGKAFLYLYTPFDNGDADICGMYQMSGGKLKQVINCNKAPGYQYGNHTGGSIIKASGNTVTIRFRVMSRFSGYTQMDYTYTYKSGTLKRNSNTGKLTVGTTPNQTFKAKKNIAAYSSPSCASKTFTIKTGQQVKFLKCYFNGSVVRYQVSVNGKTGWIKVGKSNALLYKRIYKGWSFYESPFEGVVLAG